MSGASAHISGETPLQTHTGQCETDWCPVCESSPMVAGWTPEGHPCECCPICGAEFLFQGGM